MKANCSALKKIAIVLLIGGFGFSAVAGGGNGNGGEPPKRSSQENGEGFSICKSFPSICLLASGGGNGNGDEPKE